jgi:hypothetical protein
MHQARMMFDLQQGRYFDRPGPTDSLQIVTNQVDDHHVLGLVLGLQIGFGRPGPLDRPRSHHIPVPAQKQLG